MRGSEGFVLKKSVLRAIHMRFAHAAAAQARWLHLARSDPRKETDLIALAAGLLAVLLESMLPAYASLWLRDVPSPGERRS